MSSDNINACVSKQIEINDNMSVQYWIKYPNAQCSKQYAKSSIPYISNNEIGCASDIKSNIVIEHQIDFQNAGSSKSHALPSETY